MEHLFDDILDRDETIITILKPNKAKLYFSLLISYFFVALFCFAPIIIGSYADGGGILAVVISLIVFVFITFIFYLCVRAYYNKRYYAYTNKRIIIRTGIIGIDFKSLDMAMIGAIDVYVSFLDKLLKKNTGTIVFGSMASPMGGGSNNGYNPYKFSHVVMPYGMYKEIKSKIDEYKNSKRQWKLSFLFAK